MSTFVAKYEPSPAVCHLDTPEWWEVLRPSGNRLCRVENVTAMSIVAGWLILWRYEHIVGAFAPGLHGGAFVTEPPVWR